MSFSRFSTEVPSEDSDVAMWKSRTMLAIFRDDGSGFHPYTPRRRSRTAATSRMSPSRAALIPPAAGGRPGGPSAG